MNEYNESRLRLHQAHAQQHFALQVFGDSLSKKEKYKSKLEGFEAIWYYLIQKHHWTPAVVRAMSYQDLRFALSEELASWTLPAEARA